MAPKLIRVKLVSTRHINMRCVNIIPVKITIYAKIMVISVLIGLCLWEDSFWACSCKSGTWGRFCEEKHFLSYKNVKNDYEVVQLKRSDNSQHELICTKKSRSYY